MTQVEIDKNVMTALLRKLEELIETLPMDEEVQFAHGNAALKKPDSSVVRFSTAEIIDFAECLKGLRFYKFKPYAMDRMMKLAEAAKKHEYEMSHGEVEVDGIKIQTRKKSIEDCNILSVEVGTTGPQGGDTGHGGRTYFRISNDASTDMRCIVVTSRGKRYEFDNAVDVDQIEIMFGGDSELDTFISALDFAAEKLREGRYSQKLKYEEL